jgi:N-acetylneuraminic acid mutarotase
MGTRFGTGFDASRVMLTSWGALDINFNGCDRGTLAYASLDATFGSGTLAPSRLTTLASAACHASKPSVPAGGTWGTGATMAILESETGLATVGTRSCTMGGYTSQRTFQCYDAASNSWTVMPPMPAGRDHGEAVAYDGAIYFTGGLGETGDSWGWRFDFLQNRWIAVPELPNVAASGAAMLNGFAYFAGFNAIYQFNPRTRQVRAIAGDNRAARDHSQLVAFQGELWFIAGRNGSGVVNRVVSIFDPASEAWRAGPALGTGRSGFAAAASATTLFVAGGEILSQPASTIGSAEAISAGDLLWTPLPNLPQAVHGFGGVVHGNAFLTLGGSRVAGTAVNAGDVQIYRFGP